MFKDLYAVPGWILSAANLSIPFVEGPIETCTRLGVQGLGRLTPNQVREKFPQITGELDGWQINVWNTAGWAKAGEALQRMALAAQHFGVKYITGDCGYVRKLVLSDDRCHGVVTQDGTTHDADIVIVAAGAWTSSLADLEGQLTAKGHAVAHIQMTSGETRHYRSLPILDNLELGYFLPVQEDGIFKLAHSQFVTNTKTDPVSGITMSIPHTFTENPRDGLPPEIERTMRRNLRRVFPQLADRPFCFTRLCWDADTADRHFLVTPRPHLQGLFLATGGSAHGFKFLPVLGRYIADALEGSLDREIAHRWRWRPGITVGARNLAHLDPEIELSSLRGWRGREDNKARFSL